MGDRCRCGAELLPHLHFCVGCGADRQGPPTGPSPVTTPPVTAPPVTALRGEPAPAWRAGGPPTWQAPAPSPLPHGPLPHGPHPEWPHPQQQAWAPGPRTPRPAPAPWLVALSIMLVLLISASAVLVTLRPGLVGLGSDDPAVTPAAAGPALTAPSASGPVSAAATPAASPSEELAAQVDRDRTRAAALEGSWVPQLSSKKPGTVDSGITYDAAAILGHYRGLAQQYPNTLLLWSGDWPVFKGNDYWVVVVAQPFSTPAQANAWCDAQGFGRDDCLAKRLSHSGGPAGTTVPR